MKHEKRLCVIPFLFSFICLILMVNLPRVRYEVRLWCRGEVDGLDF